MPVEIKELIVRAVATETRSETPAPSSASPDDQQALVEACVRQVLKILRRSRER